MSILSINIFESYNPKTISVADTTLYTSPVNNPSLEISAPGFSKRSLPFTAAGINTYNANNLGISDVSSLADLPDLPDGIYKLKFSIYPNTKVFTEIFHLRCFSLKQLLYSRYIDYLVTEKQQDQVYKDLENAWMMLHGAINCENPDMAATLYRKAEQLIRINKCKNC